MNALPVQIVHLLLRPEFDELPGVLLAHHVLEAEVVLDVAVAILELIQCRLKHLDSTLWRDCPVFRAATNTQGFLV